MFSQLSLYTGWGDTHRHFGDILDRSSGAAHCRSVGSRDASDAKHPASALTARRHMPMPLHLPAPESTFRVDDLSCDPRAVVRHQPGHKSGDVVGRTPSASWQCLPNPVEDLRISPSCVGRAGIDAVDCDPAVGQSIRQGQRYLLDRTLTDRVRNFLRHWCKVLARCEQDDPSAQALIVVLGCVRLSEQDAGARIDCPTEV